MKTKLPVALTFLLGTLFVTEYFVPHWRVQMLVSLLRDFGAAVVAGAFVLGAVNVVQVNWPKIQRREPDWAYKAVLVGSAALTAIVGFAGGKDGRAFSFLYEYVFTPANATMFALLAFFVTSAAFRAFRARNVEATLMLASAVVVMVAVTPVGEGLWSKLPAINDWILDYPNNAGRRAILVGAALGAVATGLRVILGIERSHLGGD